MWVPSDGQATEMQANAGHPVWWSAERGAEASAGNGGGGGGQSSLGSSEEVQGGFSAVDKDVLRIVKGLGEDLP